MAYSEEEYANEEEIIRAFQAMQESFDSPDDIVEDIAEHFHITYEDAKRCIDEISYKKDMAQEVVIFFLYELLDDEIPGLSIEPYSDKSFVVRFSKKVDKQTFDNLLHKFGGKYNNKLKGGPGVIFSNKHFHRVNFYLKTGIIVKNTNYER